MVLASFATRRGAELITCDDHETRQLAVATAAEQASESWDFSRTEFLADLDPGPKHDWVRAALGEPSRANDNAEMRSVRGLGGSP